jgi:hypothetical protein
MTNKKIKIKIVVLHGSINLIKNFFIFEKVDGGNFLLKHIRGNFLLPISGIVTHFWEHYSFLGLLWGVPLSLLIGCRVYSSVELHTRKQCI